MSIHRKVISMPDIFKKDHFVRVQRKSKTVKKELKKTVEVEEKKEFKEKILFKLINTKNCKPKRKRTDETLSQLEKQRLQIFMFLSSKLGNNFTDLRKSRANSISQRSLLEMEKQKTPQPHFANFYKSSSKSRLQQTSNPSLIIKSKKLFPIITARP